MLDQLKLRLYAFTNDEAHIQTKSIDGDLLLDLLNQSMLKVPDPPAPYMPTTEESAEHVLKELDPKFYERCIDVCDQEGLTMTQLILGHIMKAQEQGELHAPIRDLTWAHRPVIRTPTTYTCQQCGIAESGRRGQKFCSNVCASQWTIAHQEEIEETQAPRVRPTSRTPIGMGSA